MTIQPPRPPEDDYRVIDGLLATSALLICSVAGRELRSWGGALQAMTLIVNLGVLVWIDGTLTRWVRECWRRSIRLL